MEGNKVIKMKYDEEKYVLREDYEKLVDELIALKSEISKLQHKANDVEYDDNGNAINQMPLDDVKMEIFKTWYFMNYGKRYGEEMNK